MADWRDVQEARTSAQTHAMQALKGGSSAQTHAFLALASEIRALAVLLDHALTKAARAD